MSRGSLIGVPTVKVAPGMSNHSASFAYRDRSLMSLAEVTSKTHITDTVFAAPVLLLPRAKTAAASSFCELLLKVLILYTFLLT